MIEQEKRKVEQEKKRKQAGRTKRGEWKENRSAGMEEEKRKEKQVVGNRSGKVVRKTCRKK